MVNGASQRYPNAFMRASATVVISSAATPNEAAEAPTWLTKYVTSAYERSMNLDLSVVISQKEGYVLVDFVHGRLTTVGRVISASLHGAAEENTEEFVQMGQEEADGC
jgi:hypothetical protein